MEQVVIVKEYMNIERLYKELLEIYKEKRDDYADDKNSDALMEEYSDEYLEKRCIELAYRLNDDMEDYLNSRNHHIDSNLNNIDYDYPRHIREDGGCDQSVDAMIARLNAGDESEQAEADRDWLVDWFWETYGMYWVEYNFSVEVGEYIYQLENEEVEEFV